MQPIDVYLMYCAMKAHFGKTNYNFIKYGGKSRVPRNSFFKRKDRYFFVKLSKKYKTENEIRNYFIANFMMEQRGYVANFNDENYEKWQNKQNNFHDIFTNEIQPMIQDFNSLFEIKKSEHPKLMKEYLGKRISLETLIILDELVEYSKKWNEHLKDDLLWPDLKKLMNNYKWFLTFDKKQYRINLLTMIKESN
tara:strand:+ start:2700 stop:3281 length:582 start_codon:yes stop_codon:yes gene_type:complete